MVFTETLWISLCHLWPSTRLTCLLFFHKLPSFLIPLQKLDVNTDVQILAWQGHQNYCLFFPVTRSTGRHFAKCMWEQTVSAIKSPCARQLHIFMSCINTILNYQPYRCLQSGKDECSGFANLLQPTVCPGTEDRKSQKSREFAESSYQPCICV